MREIIARARCVESYSDLENLVRLCLRYGIGREETYLDVPIKSFNWTVRTANALNNSHPPILTLGDLLLMTDHKLLRIRGFGRKSLREVRTVVSTVMSRRDTSGIQKLEGLELIRSLSAYYSRLSERDRTVFEDRCIPPMIGCRRTTLEKTASKIGLSRERSRQIQHQLEHNLGPFVFDYLTTRYKFYLGDQGEEL